MQAPMHLEASEKPADAVESAVSSAAQFDHCKFRLFVQDKQTGCQFLVDRVADVSIIPPLQSDTKKCAEYKLYSANGTEIPTYGIKMLTLDLGLRWAFEWPFVVAKVSRGILGADFLNQFQLLIDIHNKKLIDGVTQLSIKGEVAAIQDNNLSSVNKSCKYFDLLCGYPDITKPNVITKVVKHDNTR